MAASIVIDRLTKRYPGAKTPSLDGLTITVDPGEVYGFLGANGAGKSTTIRLLMNFLQPTSGSAKIMGLDIVKDSVTVKKHVGYLSGDVVLPLKPSGKEVLDYLQVLQGVADHEYRGILEKRFEAETDKSIGSLSKGNRQKIGIIQALMHRPDVLILDEPTSGLDPLMQEAFYASITEASQRGTAVFMSSHNLAEAQRVCDRVGIIKHGKLIREQTIDENSFDLTQPVFRVTVANHEDIERLRSITGLQLVSQADSNTLLLKPSHDIRQALRALSEFEIKALQTEQLSLEDEFLEFYGDAS